MRTITRTATAVGTAIAVIGLAAGTASAAKSKEVSAAKYAKTMCTTYNNMLDDLEEFTGELNASTTTDPATLQTEVRAAADKFLSKLAAAEKKLKSIHPDVDGGKAISKQFAKNSVEIQDAISEAVDEFTAADPTSPAFTADVTILDVALRTLGTKLSDATTGITDQDFIGAVGDTKACEEIFPVYGG